MKLLILSFYFPPDLSAGSFRTAALVEALQKIGGDDLSLEVITTLPNRYGSFTAEALETEVHGNLRIRRIRLPSHQSGMADQARAFSTYARQVRKITSAGNWDLVFATSSRLMTAALGAHVSRRVGAPLYLDIRDLFTDTMEDVLAQSKMRLLLPLFRWIESRTLNTACRVNVVSGGFLDHMNQLLPDQDIAVFTNGIDKEFLEEDFSRSVTSHDLPVILYGGNMGEGQGLHNIVPEAANLLRGVARLRLIGDGGRRSQLQHAVEAAGCSNVELLPPMSRTELMAQYRLADILFLHLNDHAAFRKVLPSKAFEYAATGKPMLAGVAGYPADFLRTQLPGCSVFAPCDAPAMAEGTKALLDGPRCWPRQEFVAKFSREKIMQDMAKDVLNALDGR